MAYLQNDYARVRHQVKANDDWILLAEEEILGYNHTHIGHLLAERWNLPAPVPEVILHHHTPELAGEFMREAASVHLADIFCRALEIGSGGDHRIPPLDPQAWEILGLKTNDIEALLHKLETEYHDICPFIQATTVASPLEQEA